MRSAVAIAALMVVSGCAKSSSEIPAQYVSSLQYSSYNCKQIEMEMQNVSGRVTQMAAQTDKAASNDSVAMGAGLILFWPALFFLDSNSAQAAEYGRLKGEFDALEKVSVQKECGFHIDPPKVVTADIKKTPAAEFPNRQGRF